MTANDILTHIARTEAGITVQRNPGGVVEARVGGVERPVEMAEVDALLAQGLIEQIAHYPANQPRQKYTLTVYRISNKGLGGA